MLYLERPLLQCCVRFLARGMQRSLFGANGYMAATLPILLAFAAVVLLLAPSSR